MAEGDERRGGLERAITPRVLLVLIVGDILGAGIYAVVGEVAGEVGGALWAPFLVAFTLAFLTAFSYAELVTKYPRAAGAALYVDRAFDVSFLTFMVAFAVVASGITSASTAARAFGGDYLSELVELPVVPVALVFVLVLAVVNFIGISESVKANVVLTIIEAAGLLAVVVVGLAALLDGLGEPARALEFKEGTTVPLAVLGGASLAFYSMIGFEDSVNLAEEVEDPRRAFPMGIFVGLAISLVAYLAVAVIASMVVDTGALTRSSGPLLEVVKVGPLALPTKLFSAVALVAVTNTALMNMLMASRLTYGMANEGVVPRVFGTVHPSRRTPWAATVFVTLLALVLVWTGEVETLADTTVFLLVCVFAVVNVSVLVLRRHEHREDHFRAPTIVPILGALACLILATQQEARIFLRAGLLLVAGSLLWLVNLAVRVRQNG